MNAHRRDFRRTLSVTSAVVALIGATIATIGPASAVVEGGQLMAGAAEGRLDIPVGVPLGGYLRPPVGGDLLPALEAMSGGSFSPLVAEVFDFTPVDQDDPTKPQASVPDEARGPASPWTTFMPPSRGYYETLLSKAIALSDGDDTMVIVKSDVIGSLDELRVEVAKRVFETNGVELDDRLILTATHTHDGPGALATNSTRYFFMAMDAFQPEIFDRVAQQLADVVVEALDNMQPARIGHATGQESHSSSLNSWRRSRSPWSAARQAQQEPFRKRMGLVRIDAVDGAGAPTHPIAAIMNYSAHGIMFGIENLYYSGDALGAVERAYEDSFDTPVVSMFVQSALGDVSPRADGKPTLQRVERFGALLAPQMRALADGITDFDTTPDIEVRSQRFTLNRQTLDYAEGEYPYEFGAVQCNGAFNQEECLAAPPPDASDLADNGVAENGTFVPMDSIVTGARIGDLMLIGQPGEPVTEHGLRVIEASPFAPEDTFIVGLAQDHVGYILPDSKEDWLLGGTEGTTTFWGWKQGAKILDVSRSIMEALAGLGPDPIDELTVDYLTIPFQPLEATVSPAPGAIIDDASDIARLEATAFTFEGGDPVLGTPRITIEEQVGGTWAPVTERGGRPMDTLAVAHLDYTAVNGSHHWRVDFEAPFDWPVGTYRIAADGLARGPVETAPFRTTSGSFVVTPTSTLVIGTPQRVGTTVSVTLGYPEIEQNYRIIDPLVRAEFNAPVRTGCVAVSNGATTVVATEPTISNSGGNPVATFRVTLPDTGGLLATGADSHGNYAVSDSCLPVAPDPLVVTSVTPSCVVGDGVNTVTITGTGFGALVPVSYPVLAGYRLTEVVSWSPTQVVARVPQGWPSGFAGVVVDGVTSNGIWVEVVDGDDPDATGLHLDTISPDRGPAGTEVTFTGTGFGDAYGCGEAVAFAGVLIDRSNVVSWSDTAVVATAPEGVRNGFAGIVTNGVTSNGIYYSISDPAHVDSAAPNPVAGGTDLTITGTGFGSSQGDNKPILAGTQLDDVVSWTETQIVVTVPVGHPSGYAGVVIDGATSNGVYVRVDNGADPQLTDISPSSGPVGTQVTFTGTGFGDGSGAHDRVVFRGPDGNPITGTLVSWTDTQVVATVPNGAVSGYIGVVRTGNASNGIYFTVTTDP